MEILTDALALQEAGAFSVVLECIPNKVAQLVTSKLTIPTIGIGAGPETDGQILVTNDMLGEITSPWHVVNGLDAGPAEAAAHPEFLPRLQPSAPQGPKFVRNFVAEAILPPAPATATGQATPMSPIAGGVGIGAMRMAAIGAYVEAVRRRSFPDPDREGYKMKGDEWREFQRRVEQ